MSRASLRADALERSGGRCEWFGRCPQRCEEMAHIRGRGMGGRPSADTLENVAMLCRFHHDVLDGRRRASSADLPAGGTGCPWDSCAEPPGHWGSYCARHAQIVAAVQERRPAPGIRVELAAALAHSVLTAR